MLCEYSTLEAVFLAPQGMILNSQSTASTAHALGLQEQTILLSSLLVLVLVW